MSNLRSFLKWIFRFSLVCPTLWWVYLGFTGGLGVQPVVKLNIETGYVALVLIAFNLALGAMKALIKSWPVAWRWILIERRSLGIAGGFYTVAHVFFYLAKEAFLPEAYLQAVTKTYLIAGTLATVLIVLMTLTSNDLSLRALGKKWKTLHRLIYVAWILILIHVFLIEKANMVLLAAWTLPVVLLELWRLVKAARTKV